MTTPDETLPDVEPDGTVSSFLSYPGLSRERYQSATNHIPLLIDVLLAAMLSMLLYINVIVSPHPIAWFVGALMAIHALLLIIKPKNLGRLRMLGLAVACLGLAILQPLRTQEHAMAFSYIAMFGLVALFLVRGTLPTLAATLLYVCYAGYMQWLDPARTLTDALSSMAGMATSTLVLLVLLHHFLIKLDISNRALNSSLGALQTTVEDLQYAASAGNLGLYECDISAGTWQLNSVMRRALELPDSTHPTVTTQDLVERSDDEVRALWFGHSAVAGSDSDYYDFELHHFRLPSGRLLGARINSRYTVNEEGKAMRHGIVIFDPEMTF